MAADRNAGGPAQDRAPDHLTAAEPPSKETSMRIVTRSRAGCPLLKAAVRTGDSALVAAVERWHPVSQCPAARRDRL